MTNGVTAFAGEIIGAIVDFFLPPSCVICGERPESSLQICRGCIDDLRLTSGEYPSPVRTIPGADGLTVLLPYDSPTRQVVHGLKYHGMADVGPFLGDMLARKALCESSFPTGPILVPVPLHPAKRRERGYNQAERIAAGFSQFSGFPVDESLLTRTRATGTQTALSEDERRLNVKGAFTYAGNRQLRGTAVIVIDDVLTTGSTISECIAVLRGAGAGTVHVAVAASPTAAEEKGSGDEPDP